MIPQKPSELFRGKLLSTTVEYHQHVSYWACIAPTQLEQSRLIFERCALDVGIARQALHVLVGQRLDGWLFRFANPRNGQLHFGI